MIDQITVPSAPCLSSQIVFYPSTYTPHTLHISKTQTGIPHTASEMSAVAMRGGEIVF